MLKNFIKTAVRSLAKNKLITFINIFGLAIAIGCSLVVFIFVDFAFSQDDFHKNGEKIFMVKNVVARDGAEQVWGDSPAPIGAALKQDFPQIDLMVRVEGRRAVLKYKDMVFAESVRFADPEFLEMFTFPMEQGSIEVLQDQSRIVISHDLAEKYFGGGDAVGEQIVLVINDKKESFIVGAVAAPFPKEASFGFDILINFEKLFSIYEKEDHDNWSVFIGSTFIQLPDPADIEVIASQMDKYVQLQNAVEEDWPAESYPFEPFRTLSMNSYKIRGDISGGDDPVGRIVLLTIGAFMLLLACFNYINIAISSATKRLKEIGIRKVIGGTRSQLIFQFIGENLIICLFALILGSLMARTMFGPWFDQQFSIGLAIDFYGNMRAWLFMIGLLFITAIGAGAYPAFYISSFEPTEIFRGKQTLGSKNRFTKAFLTFQFTLSIITLVFGIAFTQNAKYQQKQDWGYDQSETLVIPVDRYETYLAFKNDFLQNPNVVSLAGSANQVGRSVSISVVDVEDKKYEFRRLDVGYNYIETLDIRLKEGRVFDEELKTDDLAVIINQTMVDKMGWEQPIGIAFDIDSLNYNVIGVVGDFHYADLDDLIEPTLFRLSKEENFNYLSLRVRPGQLAATEEHARFLWKENVPDAPYNAYFQDEVFDRYFNNIKGHGRIMGFTAFLAIILSCMGLYGLVSLNVATRMKEFSIRKVLGAGVVTIFHNVNKQYVWLISIACLLGLPISYFLVNALFDEVYDYHMPLTAVPLIMAASFIFIVALITVSSQVYKAVVSNPVDSLREE